MKTYLLLWLDDEGNTHKLGTVTTNKPKDVLFDRLCEFIAGTTFFSNKNKPNNIRKWIETGKTSREHYFAESNGNVLSIMEVLNR